MKTTSLTFCPQLKRRLALLAATLILSLSAGSALAAESTNSAPAAASTAKRTVGLDIVKKTVNPDKTTTLLFHWSEKGKDSERSVVINDKTIVVYNGQIKKLSDLTDDQMRAKAVATVGDDGVTTLLLRFGKAQVPKDQLTPEQMKVIASLAPPATTASNAALDKRVAGIIEKLNLTDAAKKQRVTDVLATDLREVRDAHNAGLGVDASVHKAFVSGLEANLTPEQVDFIKDQLTINKVPITFKVYHQILPNLKPEDDKKIMTELTQAREESLDVKSVEEMTPIFKKHKKEIESYLNNHGYDWVKSYKAFVDGQKAAKTKTADTDSTAK